jgi:nucleoside-diphosphate-sugar epimerase
MKILITGAFGNVGRSTVSACLTEGDELTLLEADTKKTRALAQRLLKGWANSSKVPRIVLGDVRDPDLARRLVVGQHAVLHLAALIPPAADRFPELAHSVNVGGTVNLIAACLQAGEVPGASTPRFVLASSIAAYGDRVDNYWISTGDPLTPSPGDEYAATKIEAETLLRNSGLPFVILRLAAIMWRKKLDPDPLLFHMPLGTKLEICHTEDTGRAFAKAARRESIEGHTFDIGGGASCRTDYRSFLDKLFDLIGLGGIDAFPAAAFAHSGFHCGWYADSDEADACLCFRRKGLEDFYAEVKEEMRRIRPWAALVAPIVRARMLAASPFLRMKTDP